MKNKDTFRAFERNGANFKVGDRAVHMPSGEHGKIVACRKGKVCFKSDDRAKLGGVWMDPKILQFEGF